MNNQLIKDNFEKRKEKNMSLQMTNQNLQIQRLDIIAENASASGLYSGIGGKAKIFMILMAAEEMNIPPMLALNKGLNNIKGSIEISARLMTALIRRAGHRLKIVHCDDFKCIVEGTRKDTGEVEQAEFTIDQAKKAGLLKSSAWLQYPQDMLFARAVSRIGRRLFSDLIGAAYVEGEVSGNITIDPNILKEESVIVDLYQEKKQLSDSSDIVNTPLQENSELATVEQDLTIEELDSYIQKEWGAYSSIFKEWMEGWKKDFTYKKCIETIQRNKDKTRKSLDAWLCTKVGI